MTHQEDRHMDTATRPRALTDEIEAPPETEPGRRLLNMLGDYAAGAKTNRWREHVQKYADVIREVEQRDPCAIYPEDDDD